MNPILAGGIAATAIVVAFAAGTMIEIEPDGDVSIDIEQEGPVEQLGEKIDETINDVSN